MKTKFLLAAAAILAASCNQFQTVEEEVQNTKSDDTVKVTVNIKGAPVTRSTSIGSKNEDNITDYQIFVFDASSGAIESYVKGVNTLNVSTGAKDFVAMINCPEDLRDVGTKAALMAKTSLLKNNASDHFEMIGSKSVTIEGDTKVELEVERMVSKVVIESVTTAFTSAYLASQTFTIKGIYLTNVVANNNYSLNLGADSIEWFNKLKVDTTDSNKAKDLTQDTGMEASVPYSTAHSFYCYPNSCTDDSTAAEWAPRHTRLVIDTTLGYYTIKLPVLERNKVYTVKNLNITKKGSANPWEDITTYNATFEITVAKWVDGKIESNVTI